MKYSIVLLFLGVILVFIYEDNSLLFNKKMATACKETLRFFSYYFLILFDSDVLLLSLFIKKKNYFSIDI